MVKPVFLPCVWPEVRPLLRATSSGSKSLHLPRAHQWTQQVVSTRPWRLSWFFGSLGGWDFEVTLSTSVPDLEIVYKTKSRGTKVELISSVKISTSFAQARQSRKAIKADDGKETSPPSSLTAPSGSERYGWVGENSEGVFCDTRRFFTALLLVRSRGWPEHLEKIIIIDWCCFHYFVRNSLVTLLEALCARILFFRFVNINFSWHFFPFFFLPLFFLCVQGLCL